MKGGAVGGIFTLLLLGGIGALFYTAVTNPKGVKALGDAGDNLLKTAYGAELGKVA